MDMGYSRIVGENHIKLNVKQEDYPDFIYDAIAFQLKDRFEIVKNKIPFDICYSISENSWRGKTNLQLIIKDIKQ
jgi:single-stranded-DNA-specific exonuclease